MTETCRDINALTPLAQTACRLFMDRCKAAGLDIFITETYRSQKRQDELYEQGRTKLWDANGNRLKIVTWTLNSRHTSRRAWDIACNGKVLYDRVVLKQAGEIAKALGITWGGSWAAPDMPHFEITSDWKAPKELVEVRYNNINEIPEWGRPAIRELIDAGCFGDEKALDISEDMLRVFVILSRKK